MLSSRPPPPPPQHPLRLHRYLNTPHVHTAIMPTVHFPSRLQTFAQGRPTPCSERFKALAKHHARLPHFWHAVHFIGLHHACSFSSFTDLANKYEAPKACVPPPSGPFTRVHGMNGDERMARAVARCHVEQPDFWYCLFQLGVSLPVKPNVGVVEMLGCIFARVSLDTFAAAATAYTAEIKASTSSKQDEAGPSHVCELHLDDLKLINERLKSAHRPTLPATDEGAPSHAVSTRGDDTSPPMQSPSAPNAGNKHNIDQGDTPRPGKLRKVRRAPHTHSAQTISPQSSACSSHESLKNDAGSSSRPARRQVGDIFEAYTNHTHHIDHDGRSVRVQAPAEDSAITQSPTSTTEDLKRLRDSFQPALTPALTPSPSPPTSAPPTSAPTPAPASAPVSDNIFWNTITKATLDTLPADISLIAVQYRNCFNKLSTFIQSEAAVVAKAKENLDEATKDLKLTEAKMIRRAEKERLWDPRESLDEFIHTLKKVVVAEEKAQNQAQTLPQKQITKPNRSKQSLVEAEALKLEFDRVKASHAESERLYTQAAGTLDSAQLVLTAPFKEPANNKAKDSR